MPVPWQTSLPIGIPKAGFPTESMAKVAARNVASAIGGETQMAHKEFADHMLPPRKAAVVIPGPRVQFEKHYLWKSHHGYVRLP